MVLRRDRVCRICKNAPSTEVDHMDAMKDDHRLFALQGVCHDCHQTKTLREAAEARARRPRARQ